MTFCAVFAKKITVKSRMTGVMAGHNTFHLIKKLLNGHVQFTPLDIHKILDFNCIIRVSSLNKSRPIAYYSLKILVFLY